MKQISLISIIFYLCCTIDTFATIKVDEDILGADWDFMFNPKDFNTSFTEYDQATAIICAKLSSLAYYTKNDIKIAEKAFQVYYPEVKIEYFESLNTGTEAIFFGCNNYIVLAFRGTEFKEKKDRKTDRLYGSYYTTQEYRSKWYNIPPGHNGFRQATKDACDNGILEKLKTFSEQFNFLGKAPIYTTGHSLGAGLSIFSIEPIKTVSSHFKYSGTFTFAAPLVLSAYDTSGVTDKFYKENAKLIYNVIYYRDLVTRLGLSHNSLLQHIGHFYRICLNHEIVKNNAVPIRFGKKHRKKFMEYHRIANILMFMEFFKNSNTEIEARTDKSCVCNEDVKEGYKDSLVPIKKIDSAYIRLEYNYNKGGK